MKKKRSRTRLDIKPFDPFDQDNLADIMGRALEAQPDYALGDESLPMFNGTGIYVFYYVGGFELYAALGERNKASLAIPIYVGRSEGAQRKGNARADGMPLRSRLLAHRRSLKVAENLSLDDFRFRFLVTDSLWVPLAEYAMLRRWVPLWNSVVDGFGNNPYGKGRPDQVRSRWDTLHPGRKAALKLPARSDLPAIEDGVREHVQAQIKAAEVGNAGPVSPIPLTLLDSPISGALADALA